MQKKKKKGLKKMIGVAYSERNGLFRPHIIYSKKGSVLVTFKTEEERLPPSLGHCPDLLGTSLRKRMAYLLRKFLKVSLQQL